MLYKTKMQKREPRQSQKKKYRYFHWLVNANTTSAYFSIHCNCSLINTAHFHIYNRCAQMIKITIVYLTLQINNDKYSKDTKNAFKLKPCIDCTFNIYSIKIQFNQMQIRNSKYFRISKIILI